MSEQPTRDTHFTGYADLIYPELARLFHAMYAYRILGDEKAAKQAEQWIKQYLAQCGYDLANHVIGSLNSYIYDVEVDQAKIINNVDDMITLPEDKTDEQRKATNLQEQRYTIQS